MTIDDKKSGEKSGEKKTKKPNPSKHTPTYWKDRIHKLKRSGGQTSTFYQTVQFQGDRRTISLGTGERAIAAAKAAKNWQQLHAEGWESLFPEKKKRHNYEGMTLPQFLEVARERAAIRGILEDSVNGYEEKLRVIVAGILGASRFDLERQSKVDSVKIAKTLTKENLEAFKQDYLEIRLAKGDDERRIKRTFNSYLRGAKALFSTDTLKEIPGAVDPFVEVKNWPKVFKKFHSAVPDFDQLINDFNEEFAAPQRNDESEKEFLNRREVFKNFVIILATGARRGEIDRLEWRHLNLEEGTCTFEGRQKTEISETTIPLNPRSLELLRRFREEAPSDRFYLKRGRKRNYEAGATSERLMEWLRKYETNDGERPLSFEKTPKPIHYLRAEVGNRHWNQFHDAAMAASYLRHDLQTFMNFYADSTRARRAPAFDVVPLKPGEKAQKAEAIRNQITELEKELAEIESAE